MLNLSAQVECSDGGKRKLAEARRGAAYLDGFYAATDLHPVNPYMFSPEREAWEKGWRLGKDVVRQ